ncbi:MAG: SRPBCC family protein [Ferruginibacter sp.]
MKLLRLLKAFFIGFICLFIVITIFSLIIPSNIKVSRVTVINNVTPGRVYAQIANLQNWKNWHPVFKSDSAIVTFTDSGRRSCDIVYSGSTTHLSITSLDPGAIKFDLRSGNENPIHVEMHLTGLPDQKSVQVEWRALTRLHWYPWEKFYGIFIDKLSGPGYEAALKGLKDFLELK